MSNDITTKSVCMALLDELGWLLSADVNRVALDCIHITVDPPPLTDAEVLALARVIFDNKRAIDATIGQKSRVVEHNGMSATVRWDEREALDGTEHADGAVGEVG